MAYEKVFTPAYPDGWEDIPSHDTPATAAIMDDYDDAIEHIENFLNGSTAIFPMRVTGGMTQPVGVDENGKLFTYPSSGSTASSVTYDNTESQLEATNAQDAIDEVNNKIGDKVNATSKTQVMTQAVGIDGNGELWTKPGSGGGGTGTWTKLLDVRDESSQTASSYTLSDDITNYETIALAGYFSHTLGNIMHVETLPIEMVEVNSSVHQLAIDNSHIVTVKFPTATSVQSVGESGGTYIYQVYGLS